MFVARVSTPTFQYMYCGSMESFRSVCPSAVVVRLCALFFTCRRKLLRSSSVTAEAVDTAAGLFKVTSGSDNTVVYDVDVQKGFCSCHSGLTGACCKHQIAAADTVGIKLPNIPIAVTPEDRYQLAVLAVGDKAPPASFFETLRPKDANSAAG